MVRYNLKFFFSVLVFVFRLRLIILLMFEESENKEEELDSISGKFIFGWEGVIFFVLKFDMECICI